MAAAINDDANYNTTLTTALATKLPLAGGSLTGALNTTGRVNLTDNNSISESYVQLGITNTVSSAGLFLHANSGSGKKYEIQSTADGKLIVYDRTSGAYRLQLLSNGDLTIAANIDTAGLLKVGGNDTEYANNYIRFKPTGAAYIDHNTVGQPFYFRTSTSSSLDTTPLTVSNSGIGVPGIIQSGSSAGAVTIIGGSTNQGGKIVLSGGNNTGATGSGIAFYSGASTATPTERMRILSGGNVGIGTDSPAHKLSIEGGAATVIQMAHGSSAVYNWALAAQYITTNAFEIVPSTVVGGSVFTTPVATFKSTGKVGIGQTAPATTLHIGDGASHHVRIENASSGDVSSGYQIYRGASTLGASLYDNPADNATTLLMAGKFNLATGGSGTDFHIDTAGKVGIGTTGPDAPLHVKGGVGMTGGWGRTAVLSHNFPVLVFQSEYSTDGFAGIGYDNTTGLKFYVNAPSLDVVGNSGANHAMTILDNKDVGIGTQNPTAKLHVFKGESGAPAPLADSVLILENSTHNYLQFLTPSSSEAGLIFGDVQNDNTAGITYSHSTDNLSIIAADDIVLSSDTVIVGNNKPVWSGAYGGGLFLKGNNATSDRYARICTVDSTGAAINNGLTVNNDGSTTIDCGQTYGLNISGNGSGLRFSTGSNQRLYWNTHRAIEGAADGSIMQIGEGFVNILTQGKPRVDSSSQSRGTGGRQFREGGKQGTGTYTLFTNGSSQTQGGGIVRVNAIYGTPSGAGTWKYKISGNRAVYLIDSETSGYGGSVPSLAWSGAALQISNSNGSVYYHVSVELFEMGSSSSYAWLPTWGNFPGIA